MSSTSPFPLDGGRAGDGGDAGGADKGSKPSHAPGSVGRARRLRREATLPEKNLWGELRKLEHPLNFRRQAPIGRYIADFACHEVKLIVELDGSRHDLPEAQLHDRERTAWLESQGYRVLRFDNEEALADPASLANAIVAAASPPSQPFPHQGGRAIRRYRRSF